MKQGAQGVSTLLLALHLVATLALLPACQSPAKPGQRKHAREAPDAPPARDVAGVRVAIAVRDPDAQRAASAIEHAYEAALRTGRLLLATGRGSEIDILNQIPSHVWIEVAGETADALRRAHEIAEASDGAFDPTDPPLRELWGVDADRARTPRDFEIEMTLRRVYWEHVEVDEHAPLARRSVRRAVIDLGDFAHGAMLDSALRELRQRGVPAARVSTRNVHAVYGGTRERPWRLRVEVPDTDLPFTELALTEGGLASAAPDRLRAGPNGTRIHELIDPRSGRPAIETRLATVAGPNARSAAAWARALFMMGCGAPAFAESRPELQAWLLFETGETFGDVDEMFHSPAGE